MTPLEYVQKIAIQASKRSDIVISIMLVAVVFMMILPLPTILADILIAINMGLSSVLLMVAMYLPTPLAFSSFPSVLLMTTLFRLALSIATTRLILLHADAGHIVETFGNFVVGGNFIVGLVVFLILTIVQFLVITKGSERVAEVAARFSLDGMPGKQMSIDADMRAGTIDMNEAKKRRKDVEKESQLYGAMDGAMKFVKGDAIASMIIVVVNLTGGILIGTIMNGMTFGDAIKLYSILTVGDGLIAQIPALLISITAGIIVTRVNNQADGESPTNVGKDIVSQLLAQPNAILVAGFIMLGFAIIPGMPTLVFLTLATVAGGVGGYLYLKSKGKIGPEDSQVVLPPVASQGVGQTGSNTSSNKDGDIFLHTVPIIIDVAEDPRTLFDTKILDEKVKEIRRNLYYDLGVPFPPINIRQNQGLPEGRYHIQVNEIPVTQGWLRQGYLLARDTADNLKTLNIPCETDSMFLYNIPTVWVSNTYKSQLEGFGIGVMDEMTILTCHVTSVMKRYAAEFIGIQETRTLLARMDERFPDLMKELQRVISPQKASEIFKRLIAEEVSIRNLRGISEALVEWGATERDTIVLTEHIRIALKRQISYKCSAGKNVLPVYLLQPEVEDFVRNSIRQTSSGSFLALDPEISDKLINAIKTTVGDLSLLTNIPVLLTSMDIRRYVRKLIETDMYDLRVMSYQELSSEINVQPIARIHIDNLPEYTGLEEDEYEEDND